MGMAMEWLRSWHRMEEGWECDGMAPFLAQDGGWRRDGNGDGMAPFLEQDGGRMGMAVAWLPSWHRMEGWEWLSLGRLCLLGSDGGRWRRARSQERITLAGQIGVLQINTICFSSGLETWGKCQNHIHYEEYVRALWDAFLKIELGVNTESTNLKPPILTALQRGPQYLTGNRAFHVPRGRKCWESTLMPRVRGWGACGQWGQDPCRWRGFSKHVLKPATCQ